MKGWELTGEESLGMTPIDKDNSPFYRRIPAPRVMQNQLDSNLEAFIFKTEKTVLKDLQEAILKRSTYSWNIVCLTTIVLLHVLEKDSWRLLYWKYHPQEVSYYAAFAGLY